MLFAGGSAEIDSRRLDALVPHKVGKKGDVIEAFEEILCESVTERMGVYHFPVDAIFVRKMLQLHGDASRSYPVPESVEEQITRNFVFFAYPIDGLGSEILWNIKPANFSALAVKIKMSCHNVFDFYLKQFTDTRTCRSHKPDHEIPFRETVLFQFRFQELVISIADDILQKVLLLNFDEFEFQPVLVDELKILVDSLQPKVHCLWLEVFHKKSLIGEQILLVELSIVGDKVIDSPHIGLHGVAGQVGLLKTLFEFIYHNISAFK